MDKLNIVIVPVGQAFAVLPASMVRQILPYAPLIPADDTQSACVLGSLIVQSEKVDVVDIERVLHSNRVEGSDEKLIWFSPLHRQHTTHGFMLRASGLPQFMICRNDDLVERGDGDHPLIARYIDVRGLNNPNEYPVFIMDLVNLEQEIAR